MNNPVDIAKMIDIVTRLKSLLEDPQTGMFTWHEAVGRVLSELDALRGFDPKQLAACTPPEVQ